MKVKYPIKDAYALSIAEIVQELKLDISTGLTKSEAEKRNLEFGLNIYHSQKPKSVWLILIEQFASPIVYLLFVGAAFSVYFKDFTEAIAILIVIFINALIGFFMEMQARSSMKALKEMDVIHAKVLRNGKLQEIPSENLTLGDIVSLEAGDVVPGDARLIEINQLQCDESSLTGESVPTEKNTEQLEKKTGLGDQNNMVFKGTSVINGNAKGIIVGLAENTQLGLITSLLESHKETKTPLDRKLFYLSKKLIWLTLLMTLLFAVTGFIQGKTWIDIIKTSIVLAIAAFPEGLPVVSTIALAYGMLLMAKRKVIVKKISAVETLGSTNVILTDKTGTLTENKIYVDTISFPDESLKIGIENGNLKYENGESIKTQENFEKLKLIGALCNNAVLKNTKINKKELGDPLEIALLQLAMTAGTTYETLAKQYPKLAEMPFNSETKIMGTLHTDKKQKLVAAKGSVEHLIEKCSKFQSGTDIKEFGDQEKAKVLAASEEMANKGLRVLAFAFNEAETIDKNNFLENLTYVGMIGFLDPPRKDIKGAILACRNAGIKIVMITGDHPLTALNIANEVGLVNETEQNVINGAELSALKTITPQWKKKILETSIFARTTPKQKLDIVEIYQKAGNIVAMTGDGINDAPALKKADVGIAMGLRGTQVAKETASIVLKNDSFKSIVAAVAQGRTIFLNIRKFVVYLVSCNLSEIFIVTVLGFIAPAASLLPLQILFLNMVTDVFPALAMGLGKGDKTVMDLAPKDPKDPIVTTRNWVDIAMFTSFITLSVILAVVYCQQIITTDQKVLNNVAFVTLAFAQLFHVFNMSSDNSKLFVNEITKNIFVWLAILLCSAQLILVFVFPQMRLVLGLVEFSINIWIVCLLASLLPLLLGQIYKFFRKPKNHGIIPEIKLGNQKSLLNSSRN